MNVERFIASLGESEFKEELSYCDLDNIVKKPLLRKSIRKIVELVDEGFLVKAYSKTSDLLMRILYKYVAPKIDSKKELYYIEMVTYFILNKEKNIAELLKSINAEFNMVEQPNIDDICYLLIQVCRTYDMLFERYGELDFEE